MIKNFIEFTNHQPVENDIIIFEGCEPVIDILDKETDEVYEPIEIKRELGSKIWNEHVDYACDGPFWANIAGKDRLLEYHHKASSFIDEHDGKLYIDVQCMIEYIASIYDYLYQQHEDLFINHELGDITIEKVWLDIKNNTIFVSTGT